MKKILLFIFLVILSSKGFSATYYFNGSGNLDVLSSWDDLETGTGTAPANFTGADTFIISSVTADLTLSLATTWTLGTNTIVQIGNNTPATWTFTHLTITSAGSIVNATVNISEGKGLFINHALTIQSNTIPNLGTLSTTFLRQSKVDFAGTGNITIPAVNYGDLTISGNRAGATITLPAGTIGISSTFVISASGSPTYAVNPGNVININGQGNQSGMVPTNFTYANLTFSNAGLKSFGSTPTVNGIFSIQGDAYSSGNPTFGPSAVLEFKDFTTSPRTRSSINDNFKTDNYSIPGSPLTIRVADNAIINIDNVIPVQVNPLPAPYGTWSTPQCKMFCTLEITGSGRVNINNGCRIDLFKDLVTSAGGELTGVLGSRIHISGTDGTHNYGTINTLGYLCLDKDVGTAFFNENVTAGEIYVWNPQDATAGNGGIFSFNPAASITAGDLIIGQAAPGSPSSAAAYPAPATLPNTNGTLRLNNTSLGPGATHSHTVTGNLIFTDGILDFSSADNIDDKSVKLNVGGNFTKTNGIIKSSNPSTSGSFGQINFNGNTQNIFNTTAGSSNTEVSFHVVYPSVSTLTNNFELNNGAESFEVDDEGTLVFDATKIISSPGPGGLFSLNFGGTVRTANLAGINSSGATGSIQTGQRYFSSDANLHYNGAAAQNTGVFTTDPDLLTVRNLTIDNTSNVTGQQAFTVNGACTLTNGKFIIGTPQVMTLNGTFTGSNANSLRANGATDIFIGGLEGNMGTLFFDQTTPGKSYGTGPADFVPLSLGTTNRLNNLTINRGTGSVTLGNEVQITNTVNPIAGTIASNGNLVMLSTATTSSSIGVITAGSSNITGDVNVQSFFTGGFYLNYRGTRMISSPIQEVAFPNNFFRKMRDRFVITGPGGVANGFDEGGVKAPFATTLLRYVEIGTPTTSYATIKNINEAATIGRGYFFFYRGNKSNSATASPAPSKTNDAPGEVFAPVEDWTATYIGNINKGNITYAGLTRTNAGTDAYAGFHLLGNPYPSTLNFAAFRADNPIVDDYLCVVKKTRDGYAVHSGGYNNNTTNPLAVFGSSNIPDDLRNIQPGQGFYVRINAAGSVTFRESHKSAGVYPVRLLSTRNASLALANINNIPANTDKVLRYFIQDTLNYEQATTVFGDKNDANYMGYDAPYNANSVLGTSTLTADNKNVCINFMPNLDRVEEIKIAVASITSNDKLKLNFNEIKDIVPSKELVLKDNYLKTFTRIDTANNKYNFTIDKNNKATFGNNRFVLLMKQRAMITTDFKVKKLNSGNLISWSSALEANADSCIIEKSLDGINFTSLKRLKLSGNSSMLLNYSHLDANPFKGLNYYRLKVVSTDRNYTYTDAIYVNYDLEPSNLVSIYPTAVKNVINIAIRTLAANAKNIQIYDMNGKLVKSYENVNQSDVSRDVSDLSTGIYLLKIRDFITNRIIYTGKFIKE